MSENVKENRYRIEIEQIQQFLPHRYPFLLVDRVLEIHPSSGKDPVGTRVVALKNISFNEPCFQGHFPGRSIFPGVLVIEALAQAASFSLYPALEKDVGRLGSDFESLLLGVDAARFRRPVVPGDTLRLETAVTRVRGSFWSFRGVAFVDGKKVAEADLLASLSHQKKGGL